MKNENIASNEAQRWLGEAIGALRSKNPLEARSASFKAIELGEDGATVWGVLALACRDIGDFEIDIELHPEVIAKINIKVSPQE